MYSVPRSTPKTADAANTLAAKKNIVQRRSDSGDNMVLAMVAEGGRGPPVGYLSFAMRRRPGFFRLLLKVDYYVLGGFAAGSY